MNLYHVTKFPLYLPFTGNFLTDCSPISNLEVRYCLTFSEKPTAQPFGLWCAHPSLKLDWKGSLPCLLITLVLSSSESDWKWRMIIAVNFPETVSWLWKLQFFLFDFVTWFCHSLHRHTLLLRNVLTGNQTASFYFQVGIYSAVPSHHFARTKYMYILRVVHKNQLTCKNLCVFYIFTYL